MILGPGFGQNWGNFLLHVALAWIPQRDSVHGWAGQEGPGKLHTLVRDLAGKSWRLGSAGGLGWLRLFLSLCHGSRAAPSPSGFSVISLAGSPDFFPEDSRLPRERKRKLLILLKARIRIATVGSAMFHWLSALGSKGWRNKLYLSIGKWHVCTGIRGIKGGHLWGVSYDKVPLAEFGRIWSPGSHRRWWCPDGSKRVTLTTPQDQPSFCLWEWGNQHEPSLFLISRKTSWLSDLDMSSPRIHCLDQVYPILSQENKMIVITSANSDWLLVASWSTVLGRIWGPQGSSLGHFGHICFGYGKWKSDITCPVTIDLLPGLTMSCCNQREAGIWISL